jgi:hypothetical protein
MFFVVLVTTAGLRAEERRPVSISDLNKSQGYPDCKEVTELRMAENRQVIESALHAIEQSFLIKELTFKMVKSSPNEYSHVTQVAEVTPILRRGTANPEYVNISEIQRGDYVLASTVKMYPDAYQTICWDRVTDNFHGRIKTGNSFWKINYGSDGSAQQSQILMTSGSAFLGTQNGETTAWTKTQNLSSKFEFFTKDSLETGVGRLRVISNNEFELSKPNFFDFSSPREIKTIFLVTETTGTYFVGQEGHEILAIEHL